MSLRESDVFALPKPKPKRRTKAADRESAVVRECLLWLRRYGALVIRSHSGLVVLANGCWMKQGMAGWPDICGVLPDGRFVAIECKASTRPRERHTKHLRLFRSLHPECAAGVVIHAGRHTEALGHGNVAVPWTALAGL